MKFLSKNLFLVLLFSILILAGSSKSFAENKKIYFVDFNKVLTESKSSKAALDKLKNDMTADYKVLENKKKDIDKKRNELLQKASVLSSSALEEKQKELQKEERDLMFAFNDKKETYARKKNALFRSLISKIQNIVQDLSKKNGYPLVIQKGDAFVVYANDDYDITDDVIKQFN